ncbi:MAG: hypothetical protein J5823_07960 [Paludibacteraceae bacterium]|nr:hypothetical protein [Paludibacteraceae bacterium]
MKALRYLLVATAMVFVSLSASAQFTKVNHLKGCTTFGQEERQYQFHSTSAILHPGSSVDADGGVFTTCVSTGKPMLLSSRSRRVGESGFEDEEEPELPANPNPIGDGMWALLMMAGGCVVYRRRKLHNVTD